MFGIMLMVIENELASAGVYTKVSLQTQLILHKCLDLKIYIHIFWGR